MTDRGHGTTTLPAPSHCATCRRPLGVTAFVSQGYIGTYVECEWCFTGAPRPVEPELITDTFTQPPPSRAARSLDAILDRLTGERA